MSWRAEVLIHSTFKVWLTGSFPTVSIWRACSSNVTYFVSSDQSPKQSLSACGLLSVCEMPRKKQPCLGKECHCRQYPVSIHGNAR